MHLENFLHGDVGRVMVSVVLGLGLATFFKRQCQGDRCVVHRPPPPEDVQGKTFRLDATEACYVFDPVPVAC